jgi:hypothetical protein
MYEAPLERREKPSAFRRSIVAPTSPRNIAIAEKAGAAERVERPRMRRALRSDERPTTDHTIAKTALERRHPALLIRGLR